MIEDGIKISELTEASSVTGTDIVPIVNDTETKSATINQIATYTNNQLPPYEACVATLTSNTSISGSTILNLNLISKRYGPTGNFTMEDNGIKIGANIHHVKVSGNIFVQDISSSNFYMWGRIYQKRGTGGGYTNGTINSGNSDFISTPITPVIIDTQEGDILKLTIDTQTTGTVRGYADNTYLLIEKID